MREHNLVLRASVRESFNFVRKWCANKLSKILSCRYIVGSPSVTQIGGRVTVGSTKVKG